MAERVGRNDASFREANERINDLAESMELEDGRMLPFLCECADVSCTQIVQLTGPEYEAIRKHPARFFNAPGHEVNAKGWARVLEERDGYVVLDKVGDAAEVAEQLDPRTRHPA